MILCNWLLSALALHSINIPIVPDRTQHRSLTVSISSAGEPPHMDEPLASLSFAPIDPVKPNVLLYQPDLRDNSRSQKSDRQDAVKVVILATWLGGASASRIAVYCRGYQALFPSASILLIRTVLSDITIKSCAMVQAQLEPARDFLMSTFPAGTAPVEGKALLHMFSHGGCNSALQLSRLLRGNDLRTTFPIPLLGVVLDSCPGSSSFAKAYSGAVYSLPNTRIPGADLLGRACLLPVISAVSFLQAYGLLASVEDLRRELNDLNSFGPVSRLYLHSKGDRLVAAEDVASHAEEIGKSLPVWRETWEVAEHVALPLEDAGRYWDAVCSFVENAQRQREARL
jgi:hypothetical protein